VIANPFDLAGKVAFVTGAGRGLGREFARALAAAGADIVVAEMNAKTGPQAAREIRAMHRKALSVRTDVTKPASVAKAVHAAVEKFKRIDILVNNAGITIWKEAEKVSLAEWRRVVDVNFNGLFYCCRAVGRVMIRQGGGSIINIASMSGTIVNVPQAQASYNATKAAVVHLTKSLAVEWAKYNVRVNSISPGFMATPMAQPFFADPKVGGVWMPRIPMGRPGRPEELGPLAIYLASEAASSYLTGCDIIIDGGYTCE